MTNREHIAALVFASMWTNLARAKTLEDMGLNPPKLWAELAVRAADVLIEELKK